MYCMIYLSYLGFSWDREVIQLMQSLNPGETGRLQLQPQKYLINYYLGLYYHVLKR